VEIDGYDSAESITQVGTDVLVSFSDADQITFQNTDVATVQAGLQFGIAVDDILTGGPEADFLRGFGGDDTIIGGDSYDTLAGESGSDTLFGGAGDDFLSTGSASSLRSSGEDIVLDRGLETDTVYGGDGDDFIFAGYGDNVDGGANTRNGDALYISFIAATQGVSFDLNLTTQTIGGGTITGIESVSWLEGSNYGDYIDVTAISSREPGYVYGLAGDDTLIAAPNTWILDGGEGNDILDGRESALSQALGGAGNDTIYGSLIAVGGGFDQLDGGDGEDRIYGGTLNEMLSGGDGIDTFVYAAGGGRDTITDLVGGEVVWISGYDGAQSVTQSGTDVVVILSTFDKITFQNTDAATVQTALRFGSPPPPSGPTEGADTLTGTSGDDVINALGGNDVVNGLGGNDTVDGGTGADRMDGGAGNDGYVVDNVGDVVIESSASGGIDTVSSSVSFALGSQYIENLVLTGSAAINGTGNGLDNVITGNSAANTLGGRDGNDTLYGMGGNDILDGSNGNDVLDGGIGADRMDGGAGNDTYVVDDAVDVVVETMPALGIDTVNASVSFAMGTQYIENLVLTSGASINGLGNSLDNVITGNSGVNTLGGRNGNDTLYGMGGNDSLDGGAGNDILDGGTGADRMEGASGDDIYYVDDAGDQVVDSLPAGGNDSVYASVSYSVATQYIETLILTGASAINATGNSLANTITGNAAANALNGGNGNDVLDGGAGADTLIGGNGDDTYYVDDAGDVVVENSPTAGTDTVNSSVSFAMGTQYIENLVLTGTDAINGTGNSLANALTGNSASNPLSGGNGSDVLNGLGGNDVLIGGNGLDSFVFAGTPGNDTINDFASGADKIDLSAYGITMAQVSTSASGANTLVAVDSDSNGVSDFTITLIGASAPQEADYVF
jgi:Ca2+-binding RTX toxin-like protein